MTFITKVDLSKQAKINLNEQANLDGSLAIGQNFFITGIQIDTNGSFGGYALVYDPLANAYQPAPLPATSLSAYRIIFGMSISGDPNNNLIFNVNSGIYQVGDSFYRFTGDTVSISSGDPTFTRYDVLFVTGGTTNAEINTVYVHEGIASANPLIPMVSGTEVIVGIIEVPAGLSPSTGTPIIYYPNLINATQVTYVRGIYNNVEEFLDGNYVRPEIKSFNNNINELVFGQTASAITLTWVTNKTGVDYVLSPTGNTLNNTTFSYTFTGINISGSTANTTSNYVLTFDDGIQTATALTSVNFYNKLYYGTFSGLTINSSQVIALNSSIIKTNSVSLFNIDGESKYVYICYPSRLGQIDIFVNGLFSNAFTETIQNVTNEYGFTEPYNIIRTDIIINSEKMFFEGK